MRERPELEQLSYFKVENSHPKPINRNPTFYSTSPQCSNSPTPTPTLLVWEQFPPLSVLSVFLLLVSTGYSSRGASRQEPVISTCSQCQMWHFVWGLEHLTGGLHSFTEQSFLMRLNVENKQERSCSLCGMPGCRVWTRCCPPLSILDLLCVFIGTLISDLVLWEGLLLRSHHHNNSGSRVVLSRAKY